MADKVDREGTARLLPLVTAGASAPESVVQECVDFLKNHFGATVEVRSLREETVQFQLPQELRAAVS